LHFTLENAISDSIFHFKEALAKLALRVKFDDFDVDLVFRKLT
jgi:hypothetical protein